MSSNAVFPALLPPQFVVLGSHSWPVTGSLPSSLPAVFGDPLFYPYPHLLTVQLGFTGPRHQLDTGKKILEHPNFTAPITNLQTHQGVWIKNHFLLPKMGLEERNEVTALLLTVTRGPACLLKEAILPTCYLWPLEPQSNPLGKSTDELLEV